MRHATVSASSADVSCQPCVATLPSRASIPTTIRSAPNRATARPQPRAGGQRPSPHNHGRAQLQRQRHIIHRANPAAELDRQVAAARISARRWRLRLGIREVTVDLVLRDLEVALSENAPSRFTTCSHSAPWSAQRRATAAGSSPNTVCAAGSPCRSRTTCPWRRSIAGKMSNPW